MPAAINRVYLITAHSHGFGLGVEPSEFFDVKLSISVTIEFLEQHDNLGRRKVKRSALEDD